MSRIYIYGGETFLLLKAPNHYVVVMHDDNTGNRSSSVVGYVGVREDRTNERPFGWVTPQEVPTEKHTHRGLVSTNTADSAEFKDQLAALCQHYLEELKEEREAKQSPQQTNFEDLQRIIDNFFDSLSSE